MSELWLRFRDEDGSDRRELVVGDSFTIGRQPGNDLTIPDSRLSRTHLKIDRFGDVFVASDCGSSNGSKHNGTPIEKPVSLSDGDRLMLGGGMEIELELIAAAVEPRRERRTARGESADAGGLSSIPTAVFFAAPVLVVAIMVCGGGLLYFFSGTNEREVAVNQRTPEPWPESDDTPEADPSRTPTANPTATRTETDATPNSTPTNGESRVIEGHANSFLRRIALNDPSAYLASAQVEIVKGRIAQFRGSSSLATNLKSVKSNASQFESLASANGFKAHFLAAAALAKIGNRSADPVATVKAMIPFLNDLRISLGNSLADDNLLIMADYPRRERSSGRSLQSILEGIPRSKIGGADPREIRTIWFLRKNDKITEEMYDFALRFLAIGTIMQNPRDFGVTAEPVSF
jgi:hypothetical protein